MATHAAATRTPAWTLPAALLAACLAFAPGQAEAQRNPFGQRAEDLVNLGILGGGADVQGTEVHVRRVDAGGPAAAGGLQVGDVILGAGGKAFQKAPGGASVGGPVEQLTRAVEAAEGSRKKKPVVLTIRRGGTEQQLEVAVKKIAAHSRSCPSKCKKCDKVLEAGVAFLAKTQSPNGELATDLGGKTGKVVVTSLGGLAFLAAGVSPAKGSPVDKAAGYVLTRAGKEEASPFGRMGGGGGGNWNQVNWELSYALMFMAEMARKTKRPEYKAKCQELVKILEINQEASGGWAHGPGGPNALGYVELEIMSNYALLGMGAARKVGAELDEEKLAKALKWIEATTSGNGGVGYSTRQGQKGHGDAGRTAGAIAAFVALGQEKSPFFKKMAGFYQANMAKLPEGHVSPAQHLLAGAMGAHVLGKGVWKQYWKTYRTHVMAARKPDGSFASTPTKESKSMRNNTDLTVGPRWTTATYVLILALNQEKIPYLLGEEGKGGRKSGKTRIRVRPKTGGGS
jgi:hypothetical protein